MSESYKKHFEWGQRQCARIRRDALYGDTYPWEEEGKLEGTASEAHFLAALAALETAKVNFLLAKTTLPNPEDT